MRTGWLTVIFAMAALTRSIAQQPIHTNELSSSSKAVEAPPRELSTFQLTQPGDTNVSEHVVLKRKIRVSGSLVGPAKAKSISDFSHKVVHLFNPFATDEFNPQSAPSGPVNTRAWSTMVGWNPGGSACQTDSKHDPPELRLMSLTVDKQP
jgi:hypothetical protein